MTPARWARMSAILDDVRAHLRSLRCRCHMGPTRQTYPPPQQPRMRFRDQKSGTRAVLKLSSVLFFAVPQTNVATVDWLGSDQVSKAGSSHIAPLISQPALSTNANGAATDFSQSSCRLWERDDLLRRLATFKPPTWGSKPKVVSSRIGLLLTYGITFVL